MDTTILHDKKHKDTHFLSLFLNGIILLGEDAIEQAIAHLIESKEGMLKANDVNPCKQGWHKDGNGVCVPDVG